MKEEYKLSPEEIVTSKQKEMSREKMIGINQELEFEISRIDGQRRKLIDIAESVDLEKSQVITHAAADLDKAIKMIQDALQKNLKWLNKE